MQTLVDESSPLAENPDYFKGSLYPPQAAVLYRMMELEKTPLIDVDGALLETNAGVLRPPFAFGKTVVITALVAHRQPPRRVPPMINLPFVDEATEANLCGVHEQVPPPRRGVTHTAPFITQGWQWVPPLSTLRWHPKRGFRCTLVAAATSVLSQWEETIAQFAPTLRCFTIGDRAKMDQFNAMALSGEHAEYDLILLKVGTISSRHAKMEVGKAKSVPTLTEICLAHPGVMWDRLVIDDYDTIRLPTSAVLPPAFFTWYVSATSRTSLARVSTGHVEDKTPNEKILSEFGRAISSVLPGGWLTLAACQDQLLRTTMAVDCTQEFLNKQFVLPRPVYTDIILESNSVRKLMSGLSLDPDVSEALNSGAVKLAAKKMGFSCETEAELVIRILQTERMRYERAFARLRAVEYARNLLEARERTLQGIPDRITKSSILEFLHQVREGWQAPEPSTGDASLPGIPDYVVGVEKFDQVTKDFVEKETENRESSARRVERLKENADEGTCQQCLLSWDELSAGTRFITNCCQMLLCHECVCVSEGQLVDRCPTCFKPTLHDGKINLLAIDKDMDLRSLDISAVVSATAGERSRGGSASSHAKLIDRIWKEFNCDSKIRALLQFVLGEEITCNKTCPGEPIPTLLGSSGPLEEQKQTSRKILVFAYSLQSTRRILGAFKAANIEAGLLQGRRIDKDRAKNRFRRSTKEREILIIPGSKDCPGLHLPETTDALFYHHMRDDHIRAQLGGRGQRAGRSGSLRFYTLRYENGE